MKRTFKLTFTVEFDEESSSENNPDEGALDPVAHIKSRTDALAEGLDDVLECYDFITSFDKIEEV